MLRLLFLKFVWMLRVKSKQQNTRPNRTYFSNDKNSLKMHGILRVRADLSTSRLLLNSPRWLDTVTGDETGRTSLQIGSSINPFITHPAHERLYHTTGVRRPLPFTNSSVGSFTPHKNQNSCKAAGPTEFCPFPRRLECPTICRCYNKGSKFSSVILSPWVLVQPGFKPTTSRSADRQTKSRKRERRASKLTAFARYRRHNQNGLVESRMVT